MKKENKLLSQKTRITIYIFALVIFLIDIISKSIIINNGNILTNKEVISNFFYIHYSTNTGGAFSILTNYTWLIILLSIAVLVYIDRFLIKKDMKKLQIVSLSFLIGGIVGNLFDRILRGEVIDFLSFIIFDYHFPVFNIADIFICLGSILLIIDIVRSEIHEHKSNKRKRTS